MRRGLAVWAFLVVAAGYAWWASGLRPFTPVAYASIGIPTVGLAIVALVRPGGARARRLPAPTLGSCWPWILLLALSLGLEGVGLALGGRSPTVPTLSTVVDHALRWHVIRFVLFGAWLAAGGAPLPRPGFALRRAT